jgi:hypothetical protein
MELNDQLKEKSDFIGLASNASDVECFGAVRKFS